MHAPGHQWTTMILIVATAVTLGCRGSRSFNRIVKVTPAAAETDAAEIDAPPQRLVTAKQKPQRAETSPHVSQVSSDTEAQATIAAETKVSATSGAGDNVSAKPPQSPTTQAAVSNAHATNPTSARRQPPSQTASTAAQNLSGDQKVRVSSADTEEFMAGFKDYPPHVQDQIRRQFEARARLAGTSTAKPVPSPDKTTQPNALHDQLAQSVTAPPNLPEAKNAVPEVPPTRIAIESESGSGTQFNISDRTQSQPSGPASSESDAAEESGLVATGIEAMPVQKIADSVTDEENSVKPASAARQGDDAMMVARAAVAPSASEGIAGLSDFTEAQLYEEILKRNSVASPDESEADRDRRLVLARYLKLFQGDLDAAVAAIEGMPEEQQEFYRHDLLGLWTMLDPQGHPVSSRRFTNAISQIREAAKFASAATDSLELRSLAFCTEVVSYGQIKPFSGNRFDAGQQVILYCQIDNRTVSETEQGFETHLQGHYDIYNEDNEKVVSQALPADQQFSEIYLQDYFTAYQMHLPDLSAGTYRLQLTVEDVPGKKYGQASIPFEITK